MNCVISHYGCNHVQDILLNCNSPADTVPYMKRALGRRTCKVCGCPLGDLALLILRGEQEKAALQDPSAIDLSTGHWTKLKSGVTKFFKTDET